MLRRADTQPSASASGIEWLPIHSGREYAEQSRCGRWRIRFWSRAKLYTLMQREQTRAGAVYLFGGGTFRTLGEARRAAETWDDRAVDDGFLPGVA